jgi:hypothetical protein
MRGASLLSQSIEETRMTRFEDRSTSHNGDARAHVATRAEELAEVGGEYLRAIVDRLETFVRTRPGTALLGALAAGFAFGRLVRR